MKTAASLSILAALATTAPCFAAGENGPIVITEIMVNPHGTDEGQEWVEIYNPTNAAVSLVGWHLETGRGVTSNFPAGTSLAAHAVAVVSPKRGGVLGQASTRKSTYVNTQASWNTAWGTGIQVIFVESFWDYPADPIPIVDTINGLDNSPGSTGERLQLRDASNKLIDEVLFFDDEVTETPWPDDNDSGSIQLLRDFTASITDNNNGAAWRLSGPGDGLGSSLANTALPAFPGLISYGTPGRLPTQLTTDCNGNGINDAVDIVHGTSADAFPFNNIPDSCEGDCNANLIGDLTEIALDWRKDRNANAQLDSCEINAAGGVGGVGGTKDTNANGVLDSFENKPNVVITEIMYNPAGDDEGKEYVEIYNAGATPVDISGWMLRDLEGDPATGAIPAGTTMLAGEVIVLTAGSGPGVPADILTQFRAAWNIPAAVRVFAMNPWQDRAQRATFTEEVLALLDASGQPVDVADYENPQYVVGSSWPAIDGSSSIYLLPSALNKTANDTGTNWRLSMTNLDGAYDSVETAFITDIRHTGSVGSPGIVWKTAHQTPTGEAVISEIMYNPNSNNGYFNGSVPRTEWIEVFNPGSAALNMSGWYLRDEDGHSGQVAGNTIIAPNGTLILIPVGAAASASQAEADFRASWGNICRVASLVGWSDREPLPNIGALSNSPAPGTEILTLRKADGTVVDVVNYDDDGTIWPADAAAAAPGLGTGWSIYLLPGHYNADDNDLGSNWAASLQGIDGADINTQTAIFNGFDIGSPGVLAGIADPGCGPTCPADFNGDGFVTGDDFDAFVIEFEAGNISADFDADGFVTGDDFDAYVLAFEVGC